MGNKSEKSELELRLEAFKRGEEDVSESRNYIRIEEQTGDIG